MLIHNLEPQSLVCQLSLVPSYNHHESLSISPFQTRGCLYRSSELYCTCSGIHLTVLSSADASPFPVESKVGYVETQLNCQIQAAVMGGQCITIIPPPPHTLHGSQGTFVQGPGSKHTSLQGLLFSGGKDASKSIPACPLIQCARACMLHKRCTFYRGTGVGPLRNKDDCVIKMTAQCACYYQYSLSLCSCSNTELPLHYFSV